MPSVRFFFLGFPMDEDLRARLSACDEADRGFLTDTAYLEELAVDGESCIGRRLEGEGVSLSTIEDSARNVASLIARVAPGWRASARDAILMALEEDVTRTDLLLEE